MTGEAMRPSVAAAFPRFVVQFEGRCSWMYLDTKKLVTTGVGNLIDPISEALPLPWQTKGGHSVGADAIRAEWNRVKSRTDLAPKGGFAFEASSQLRLADGDINDLVDEKARHFAGVLWGHFAAFEDWPADAQLALMDMGWNYGPNFTNKKLPDGSYMWKNFRQTLPKQDWRGAAKHCISGPNPKTRRNVARVRLFNNAATVAEKGLDRNRLWNLDPPQEDDTMPTPQEIVDKLLEPENLKKLAKGLWSAEVLRPGNDNKDKTDETWQPQTFLITTYNRVAELLKRP